MDKKLSLQISVKFPWSSFHEMSFNTPQTTDGHYLGLRIKPSVLKGIQNYSELLPNEFRIYSELGITSMLAETVIPDVSDVCVPGACVVSEIVCNNNNIVWNMKSPKTDTLTR